MVQRRTLLRAAVGGPLLLSASACAKRQSTTPPGVLNVGQISDSVAFFPLFIAERAGYFRDAGIELGQRPRLGTGAKVAAALKSGSIDLGAGVITDAFNLAHIDEGTRLVSALVTEYYVDIVSSSRDTSSADPLPERIRSLVGPRIGITGPGSGTEALVNHLFSTIGKNATVDATLVNLGSSSTAAIGALTAGRVDALSFYQPIGQQAVATGAGRILISPPRGDVPELSGALHGVVFSTTKLLDRKRHELRGFQRAIRRAQDDIHGDPRRARALLGEYLDETDPRALDALVPILDREVPSTPDPRPGPYRTSARFHVENDLVKETPEFAEIHLE